MNRRAFVTGLGAVLAAPAAAGAQAGKVRRIAYLGSAGQSTALLHLTGALQDKVAVCNGTLTLSEAQHIIATDWFQYYRDHVLN